MKFELGDTVYWTVTDHQRDAGERHKVMEGRVVAVDKWFVCAEPEGGGKLRFIPLRTVRKLP